MQLRTVEKVLAGCSTIIAATEASREGEMTFRYLYGYLGCKQPVLRLWISSLTDEAVRKGMANLLPAGMFDRMFQASDSRNKADWLLGMNASYALCKATTRWAGCRPPCWLPSAAATANARTTSEPTVGRYISVCTRAVRC